MPHSTSSNNETSALEPIAICGMACRLPGGVDSASSFWDMLVEKRDGQTPKVPASRFNIDAHYHKNLERPGSFNVMGGYFLDGSPEDFDASAFNMTPVEAMWLDPQQRRILEVAYECLESAGLPMEEVAGSNTAVFIGSFTADYQQMSTKDPDFRHNYAATGVDPGIISNRIGNIFNLRGPSFTINTACSSSVYAIHNACHALRARDCDAAIAGGVNLVLTVDQHMNTAKLGILSPTSFCHTFDASADGYGRAEGAGALYLKRLADAIRDGDAIRGVIRSTAVNTNGKVAGMGITHPSKEGQERVVRLAYEKANLDPNNTIYAELHGTGTPVGDPIEVHAVSKAMNDTRSRDKPLILGAVKPNIGHSEAASGIFAVMKAALMTERGMIPGVARFKTLNPNIMEKDWNVKVNANTIPWPSDSITRRASVSSFGYGGTNGHVVIESVSSLYPWYTHGQPKEATMDDRSTTFPHLVCFSAHDKSALRANIKALSAVADRYYVSDLAETLNRRRSALQERAFTIAQDSNIQEAFIDSSLQYGTAMKETPGVGFIFTGQGAQWAGMGREALREFPSMRNTLARLDAVLSRLTPKPTFSLLDLLLHGKGEADLNRPEVAQPACSAIQIAMVDLLEQWGIHPEVTVGHSSGEIGAAYAAGLTSAPEAIIAAYCRGQAVLQSSSEGSMIAVGKGVEDITPMLQNRQDVWIACENSSSSVTLSGSIFAIQALKRELDAAGIFARQLHTGRAYHSPKMEPVSLRYNQLLRDAIRVIEPADYEWKQNLSAMVSSVTGAPIAQSSIPADSEYWSQNLRQRVLFGPALARIGKPEEGDNWKPRVFVEIGPHAALGGPFKQAGLSPKPAYVPTLLRNGDAVKNLLSTAGNLWALNASVDLASVNATSGSVRTSLSKFKSRAESLLVDLPPYQWNYDTKHWAEPRASVEQRNLTCARHDLLGSRVSGLTSRAAIWRNVLRQRDIPWLTDHSLGNVAVFPAAGHMSLAIEAVSQVLVADTAVKSVTLRDVDISTALVVPNTDNGIEIQVQLEQMHAERKDWYKWTVQSLTDGVWTSHCEGKIAAEFISKDAVTGSPVDTTKLVQTTPAPRWYNAFHRVGFQYGPYFQQLRDVRTNRQKHEAAAPVNTLNQVFDGESKYLIHPSTVDACLQLIIISIHAGAHKTMPWGVVPLKFDEVTIWTPPTGDLGQDGNAVAWTDGFHGRHFTTHSQLSSASGELILDVKGLNCISYEAALPPQLEEEDYSQPYAETVWKPDVFTLTPQDVKRCWPTTSDSTQATALAVHFLHHKQPLKSVAYLGNYNSRVVDSLISSLPEMSKFTMATFNEEDDAIFESSKLAQSSGSTLKVLSKTTRPSECADILGGEHSLIVLSGDAMPYYNSTEDSDSLLELLAEHGSVLVLPASTSSRNGFSHKLQEGGKLTNVLELSTNAGKLSLFAQGVASHSNLTQSQRLTVFKSTRSFGGIEQKLSSSGFEVISKIFGDFDPHLDTLNIIDATADMEWSNLTKDNFDCIKRMLSAGLPTLWLTQGVKKGSSTFGNMAEGFLRAVRSELPSARITLLDFDTQELDSSIQSAILSALSRISTRDSGAETELWLRGGITHISRVVPNDELNKAHFGPKQPQASKLPLGVALTSVKSGEQSVFTYSNSKDTTLEPSQVAVQVKAMSEKLPDNVPSMMVGTVLKSQSGLASAGEKVVGLSSGIHSTVQTTSTVQALGNAEDAVKLLANLPALYTAMYLCNKIAQVKSRDRVLLLSGSAPLTAALVGLAKASNWSFTVAVDSPASVERLAVRLGLMTSAFVVANDPSSTRKAMEKCQPTVVIGQSFSSVTKEAWRHIAPSGRLVLNDAESIGDIDMSPLARGASLLVGNAAETLNKGDADANDLLSSALRIYKEFGQMFNENATVRTVHGKESHLNGFDAMSLRPTVLTFDYDAADVEILEPVRGIELSPTASYLLIGCLGGLGRSLTDFMRQKGAKNFVFVSRSGADKPEAARIVADLRQTGANVEVHRVDASSTPDLVRIVKAIDPRRPLKGVVHAAMVLRDGMYENMSYEDFVAVTKPKVDAARVIEVAIADTALDFFVMTSSISAVVGNAGQANYSAANSFLDQLAWQRNLKGQAATSLALPMVLDVGVVAETSGLETALARKGMYGIDEEEMLKAFEVAMLPRSAGAWKRFGDAHMILGLEVAEMAKTVSSNKDADVQWYGDVRFCHIRRAIEDKVENFTSGPSTASGSFGTSLKAAISEGTDAALALIASHVMKRAASTLMLPIESFELEGPSIASYGLDSMIGAEIRTWLFREFTLDIPFQELLAASLTFKGLAIMIGKKLEIL